MSLTDRELAYAANMPVDPTVKKCLKQFLLVSTENG